MGSDGVFHALYTDSNNLQTVTWFYGLQFVPTLMHQEDIATALEAGDSVTGWSGVRLR